MLDIPATRCSCTSADSSYSLCIDYDSSSSSLYPLNSSQFAGSLAAKKLLGAAAAAEEEEQAERAGLENCLVRSSVRKTFLKLILLLLLLLLLFPLQLK